jgi:hypothetical protein
MSNRVKLREQVVMVVFQQELRVRVVNISRSGCLLAVPRLVRPGTVGRLRLALDDAEYADDVRIARCTPLPDAGYGIGVELLCFPKPSESRSDAPSLALKLRVPGDDTASSPWPTEA